MTLVAFFDTKPYDREPMTAAAAEAAAKEEANFVDLSVSGSRQHQKKKYCGIKWLHRLNKVCKYNKYGHSSLIAHGFQYNLIICELLFNFGGLHPTIVFVLGFSEIRHLPIQSAVLEMALF